MSLQVAAVCDFFMHVSHIQKGIIKADSECVLCSLSVKLSLRSTTILFSCFFSSLYDFTAILLLFVSLQRQSCTGRWLDCEG